MKNPERGVLPTRSEIRSVQSDLLRIKHFKYGLSQLLVLLSIYPAVNIPSCRPRGSSSSQSKTRADQYADTAVEVWVEGAPPWIDWPSPDHFRSGSAAVA